MILHVRYIEAFRLCKWIKTVCDTKLYITLRFQKEEEEKNISKPPYLRQIDEFTSGKSHNFPSKHNFTQNYFLSQWNVYIDALMSKIEYFFVYSTLFIRWVFIQMILLLETSQNELEQNRFYPPKNVRGWYVNDHSHNVSSEKHAPPSVYYSISILLFALGYHLLVINFL